MSLSVYILMSKECIHFFGPLCMLSLNILLTVHINQLDALNFYNKFISSLYVFRAHVLIVRRAKLYYTVSGIITPIGGRPVHRLREDAENFSSIIIKISASSWLILINKYVC